MDMYVENFTRHEQTCLVSFLRIFQKLSRKTTTHYERKIVATYCKLYFKDCF